ncbi:hypothetical protein HDV00_011447 [Rhizophlyctis rosea]|nr:hypothetical protein HDV00_011447 [Rhizophlyctis rosea]
MASSDGWNTSNGGGWDEEPFDDSMWNQPPKAKPILPSKKPTSPLASFGQTGNTPIPALPPPPKAPSAASSGWDNDDWGALSAPSTSASILPRKSSNGAPFGTPIAPKPAGGNSRGWDDWGGNNEWDAFEQKVSPVGGNRPISPAASFASFSSIDSSGGNMQKSAVDREADKERRRQKMAELREARKASKLGAKKI